MLALSTLCLVALSAALRSPHLRIPSSVQPQRARLVASADQSIDHTALLAECNGDASTLAKLLSKEQLKKMCAERKLRLLRFEDVTVSAAPVQHTVTCVGFIVTEDSRPGRLQPELALPKLLANRQAIKDEWGVRDPRALLKKVKELGREEEMRLPDGTTILGREVLGEPRRGRKVVLLGDCCDASLCAHLAQGADLLVHEATNAYLPTYGDTGGGEALERTTIAHGHSTPQMAGRTAARFGARALLLTHFSQRYHPAQRGVMRAIKKLALGSSSLPDDSVATAHDALTVPVWQPDRAKPMLSLDEHEAPPTGAEASSDVQAAVAYASSLDFGR